MKQAYGSRARVLSVLIIMITAFATVLHAQTFANVPALSFTKTFGGPVPLPQVVTLNSTGSAFNVTAAATTTTGGAWLQISPSSGLYPTPAEWVVSISPTVAVTLAAGTYTGQVVFSEYPSGVPSLTVPVSLVITAAGKPFFDDMNGEVSFSLAPGQAPPAQSIQVRNGGSGTLNWTAAAATADGGSWLSLSATSGKAPTTVSVGLVPSSLPGGGTAPGTYIAMIVFQASNCTVTVPVRVTVAAEGFSQINPLNFTMPFGGLSPLPQVITVASTSTTNFNFTLQGVYTGNGGNWLQINPGSGLHATPSAFTVNVINASALPAGTYTGEVIFTEYSQNTLVLTIPVTLTIAPSTVSFFDNLPGGLSYFMTTGGTSPGQPVQIHNGGSGTLSWTATKSTADGGAWLTLSAASGKAPSILTVGITPTKLPGGGLVAGTYCGQVVLKAGTDVSTIPVCTVVGDSVFRQQNPISFTMTEGGANPLSQVLQIASNDTNFNFVLETAATGTGGSWLSVSPNSGLLATPTGATVSVSASTLPAGNYTGELVYFEYSADTMALVVPVNLTIAAPESTYFDSLPGALSFYLIAGGTPPPQTVQVRNAGSGALSFTTAANTSDGGSWLKATPASASAPATVTVSIVPASLPGGGLITGTYCGEVTFQTTGDVGTVPVCAVVGNNSTDGVFEQVNPLNFTMTTGGPNPLPQEITVASTGNNFDFTNIGVSTSTGGSWLTISPSSGLLVTPEGITVSVNASTLPAGTYTGELVFGEYSTRTMMLTVPVTLTITPATGTYFDNLPGELSFFSIPGGTPPAQSVQVRNAGAGTLKWTGSASTADGGKWLALSVASGTAPTTVSISINPGNLPGGGLVAGNYCGQVVFLTTGNTATIPVCETVGTNVFRQVNPISFTMPFGGQNPLPQVIPVTSTGTNFNFTVTTVSTSKGGSWLRLDATSGLFSTPGGFWASVNGSTLQPGTYTGEIVFSEYSTNTMVLTVPVTLTVTSCGPLFDSLPGLLSYSFVPSTTNPPSQSLQIRPAGSGALKWTASTSTSDGGAWLTLSSKSGTAPSTVTVKVVNSALPGQGLVAGNFNGQVLFQSSGGNVTVPVTVVVGPSVFSQVPALSFNMTLGGSNPVSQTFSVASTGTNFDFVLATATAGNGGSWLSISPNTGLHATPTTITVSISGSGVPAGTYTGQIIHTEYSTNTMLMSVPVILTVSDPHVPATIKATGGTPQSATVNKNFTNPLVATVQDASGNPVSGLLVTFSPPTSGASGTFACGNTAVTNSQGIATSQVFKANTVAGKYTVKATGAGLTSNPSFAMTNKAGPAASITATGGTPQSATVNTAFATDLAATVQDVYGNPVSDGTVTFNAPTSGASGAFAGGVTTAKTNAEGIATAPVFTANTTIGSYFVTAGIATFTTSPGFALTNVAGAPATIVTAAGTPQTATVNTAFATNLAVTVTDAFSNPVSGATVTFNAPTSGASGTFAGGVNTAVTNAEGLATAAVFKANTKAGAYTVTATAGSVTTSPGFALTNKAGAAATITASGGTPQTATINTAFAQKLAATVKDSFGNPISGATVTFTPPTSGASGTFAGGANTAKTSAQGVATSAVFTANGTAGSYTVTAKTGSVTTNPGYQLTNQAAD